MPFVTNLVTSGNSPATVPGMEQWALGISIAALIVAGLSVRYTQRQAVAAEQANVLNERALSTAEQADQEKREANRVRWTIEQVGSGYALRNYGTEGARDVEAWKLGIGFRSGPIVIDKTDPRGMWLHADVVPSNGSIPFGTFPPSEFVAEGHELLVRWAGHPEPVHVPLPEVEPRPPSQRPSRNPFL